MEVRIGITHSPREIAFESKESAAEIQEKLSTALGNGTEPLVQFTDSKGAQYLVPTAAIAYVEIGAETSRKVGFVG